MNICIVSDSDNKYFLNGCTVTHHKSNDAITPFDWEKYDGVFLIEPFNENALKSWTGHPHLRAFKTLENAQKEISFMKENIECEKKFLIKIPDFNKLSEYHPFKAEIEQVYLLNLHGTHRIRKRKCGDFIQYFETLKVRISNEKCREYEDVIDENRYNDLLKNADLNKNPIIKDRYCFVYNYQYFELDKYTFWDDKATLELELHSEDESYELPPEIEVIKDVTNDKRYKNNYLASKANENS